MQSISRADSFKVAIEVTYGMASFTQHVKSCEESVRSMLDWENVIACLFRFV